MESNDLVNGFIYIGTFGTFKFQNIIKNEMLFSSSKQVNNDRNNNANKKLFGKMFISNRLYPILPI